MDTMSVLGIAASAKLAGDRLVREVVSYIRESSIFAKKSSTTAPSHRRRQKVRLSRRMKASTSGLGRRPTTSRLSKKVSLMTDAELEAELDNRRRLRAKERDIYSRAMRSDKLAALESELDSLRREIGRIDPSTGRAPARSERGASASHSVRWDALPKTRRPSLQDGRPVFIPDQPTPFSMPGLHPPGAPHAGPPPPPPPPPPMPMLQGGDEDDGDDIAVDPEKQKREKAERQKRREAKKKEREQSKKKMTLADIIRSAGADPAKRLKPATKKPADLEKEEWERANREREEREERQEKERIEQERKILEGNTRKSSEKPEDNSSKSINSKQEESHKKDNVSGDKEAPLDEKTKSDEKTEQSSDIKNGKDGKKSKQMEDKENNISKDYKKAEKFSTSPPSPSKMEDKPSSPTKSGAGDNSTCKDSENLVPNKMQKQSVVEISKAASSENATVGNVQAPATG